MLIFRHCEANLRTDGVKLVRIAEQRGRISPKGLKARDCVAWNKFKTERGNPANLLFEVDCFVAFAPRNDDVIDRPESTLLLYIIKQSLFYINSSIFFKTSSTVGNFVQAFLFSASGHLRLWHGWQARFPVKALYLSLLPSGA